VLGSFECGQLLEKITPDSICGKEQSIALGNRQNGSLERGQLGADYTGTKEQDLLDSSLARAGQHQCSLHVPHAEPGHHAMHRVDRCKAQDYATRGPELFVALLDKRDDWFIDADFENRGSGHGSTSGFLTMTDAIDRSKQNDVLATANQVLIARLALPGKSEFGNAVVNQGHA
jgi:hypothetical protein